MFTYMKNRFGTQELIEIVKTWLSLRASEFFDTDIKKVIPPYDWCLNFYGDWVEKKLN
jgi:hypothetical protein